MKKKIISDPALLLSSASKIINKGISTAAEILGYSGTGKSVHGSNIEMTKEFIERQAQLQKERERRNQVFCQAWSETFSQRLDNIRQLTTADFHRGNMQDLVDLCEQYHKIRGEEK